MSNPLVADANPEVKCVPWPKPEVELSTCDGNVFALLGRCTKVLKRAGLRESADELAERVIACGSYDEALQTMMQYVEAS